MKRNEFERLVKQAIQNIPAQFADKLENVEIVIEDEPTPDQKKLMNLPPDVSLFGLYTGIPKTQRGAGYTFVLPDKITIFQKIIENYSNSQSEIEERIRKTVLHEIGHHFGLSEHQLRKTEVG